MSMYDYFFKFADEAAAIADASGTIYRTGIGWKLDRVTPGIQVWRASQDVINGTAIVHTLLTGWFGTIATTTVVPSLVNHSSLQIAIDRDLAAAGQTAILKCNITATLQDVRFSPVFAGSNYPFGNLR